MVKKEIVEQSLTAQCYEYILQGIISNAFKPGEKLTVESIKKQFNSGQSPVREALSRLVPSGLVDSEDNRGFRVAQATEAEVRDIYETFTRIETMALRISIQRGDSAWEANIVAQLHQLSRIETSRDFVRAELWAKQNYNFHVALISGCQSPLLLSIREHLYMRFERYLNLSFQFIKDDLHHNHEDHKKLAEYALARYEQEAERLMVAHINGSREVVIEVLKKNNLI